MNGIENARITAPGGWCAPGTVSVQDLYDSADYPKGWKSVFTEVEVEVEVTDVSLEAVATMTGVPLVDLSLETEPHLVRGTQ